MLGSLRALILAKRNEASPAGLPESQRHCAKQTGALLRAVPSNTGIIGLAVLEGAAGFVDEDVAHGREIVAREEAAAAE